MERPLCIECKKNLAAKNSTAGYFYKKCDSCRRSPSQRQARNRKRTVAQRKRKFPYRAYKKNYCESPDCGWSGPLFSYQLHVDHNDGDNQNNEPGNLITLCANCHAVKTWTNGEFLSRSQRGL